MKKNHFHTLAEKITEKFHFPFSSAGTVSSRRNKNRSVQESRKWSNSDKIISLPPSGTAADLQKIRYTSEQFSGRITSGRIRSAVMQADQGSLYNQALLYRSVLENEPVISAHLQTRILAVCACDWQITGEDPQKAGELTEILQNASLTSLLRQLLESLATGYAGAVICWEEGGSSIKGFKCIARENFYFDDTNAPSIRIADGSIRPLSMYHPHQFILHYHKLQSGPPGSGGLLRPLLWLYFFKHYALRDRARYLEKFGIPFLIARIRQQDFENEDIRRNILSALKRISSDGSGVVTGDAQIQTLSPGINASGEYHSFLEYIDKLYTLLILGQTASSSVSGGFSKGQIQENVRHDILEADCRALMETINNQLLHPLEQYRYGTVGQFRFQLDFSSPENLLEKAQIIKLLSESDFRISPEWIEKSFHVQLDPEEKVSRSSNTPQGENNIKKG